MGTASTITIMDSKMNKYVCIYQHYDGYIDGVGHQLAEWLDKHTLINGISGQTMEEGFCNGLGCMVAQFIHDMKTEIGNFYIEPCNCKTQEDYNYTVIIDERTGKIAICVYRWDDVKPIFKGTPKDLLKLSDVDFDKGKTHNLIENLKEFFGN